MDARMLVVWICLHGDFPGLNVCYYSMID
jgi:hypothetical protein